MKHNDIDCPGDIIPFNCSIQSNSETVHLVWRVTLPNQSPLNITYDSSSVLHAVNSLNHFINVSLIRFESDEYVESTLAIVLQSNISADQTKLECIIHNLGNDSISLSVNSSGMIQ